MRIWILSIETVFMYATYRDEYNIIETSLQLLNIVYDKLTYKDMATNIVAVTNTLYYI